MNDGPGREKDHRLRTVAVNLVEQLHAVALDIAFFVGKLGTHVLRLLSSTGFYNTYEIADAPQRRTDRGTLLLQAQQIETLRTQKRAGDQGAKFVGRERIDTAELALGFAGETVDKLDPSKNAGAN